MKYSRDIPVLVQDAWIEHLEPLRQRDEGKAAEFVCFALGVAFGEFASCNYFSDPELQDLWRHTKITPIKGKHSGRIVWLKRGRQNGTM